jgi:mannitol 2-dehydrogenase
MGIEVFNFEYDRKEIVPGILHFGVGNFHRAHEAYYTNLLLADADQKNWGICGAMILEKDESVFRSLKKQDGVYGLTVFGRTGKDEYYRIGSLVELYWGHENASAIIDKVANPNIKIISLTITEGGYNLDKETGEFDFSNKDVLYDLGFPKKPKTIFGYIAAGLRKRVNNNAGKLTVICCDNLIHNGHVCRKSLLSFFERADISLYNWARDNMSFPSSMVDRITPATLPEDVQMLRDVNGHDDLAPVYCEDVVQWVLEDNFLAGRPAWERVGIEFVNDVSKYEDMKLGFVNSVHQMLSIPAFYAGYRRVDEAVGDKRIAKYLHQYIDNDVIPYISPPPNTDLKKSRDTILERLNNKAVSDQLSRLCNDSANKFTIFMASRLIMMLKAHAETKRIAYFIASYRLFSLCGEDEKGAPYLIEDHGLSESDRVLIDSDEPLDFLGLSCFSGIPLKESEGFVKNYLYFCDNIESKGILKVMEEL